VLRRRSGDAAAVLAVAALGTSPYLASVAGKLLSDLPFSCLVWAFLGVAGGRAPRLRAVAVGLLGYLAIATRTVGVVLPAALVLRDLGRRRWPSRSTWLAVAVVALLLLVQALWLPADPRYGDQLRSGLGGAALRASHYLRDLQDLWAGAGPRWLGRAVAGLVALAAAAGLWRRLRAGLDLEEAFFLAYLAAVVAWPSYQGLRLLLPVLPLLGDYAALSLRALGRRPGRASWTVLTLAVLAVLYALGHHAARSAPPPRQVTSPAAEAALAFVRRETPPQALVVCRRPRAVALLTGRRAVVYHQPARAEELWTYLDRVGASHLLVGPMDGPWLRREVESGAGRLELLRDDRGFQVYRLRSPRPASR
jgi:hypothetical protein